MVESEQKGGDFVENRTCEILKYVFKGKNRTRDYNKALNKFKHFSNPNAVTMIWSLNIDKMVTLECTANDGYGNLTGYSTISITTLGSEYVENRMLENKRHWQKILIPHPLNILVSIITTILTVYVMKYLGL